MAVTNRAISTVVDVAVCLLLISAAVGTLVMLGQPPKRPDPTMADHVATTLGTSTTSVTVSQSAADIPLVATGSIASLLVAAAFANLSIDGHGRASPPPLERALEPTIDGLDGEPSVYVVALWRPTQNASLQGMATVGTRPPPTADVSTAVLALPSGIPAAESPNRTASVLITKLINPPATTRAIEGGGPSARVATDRLVTLADLVDVHIDAEALEPPLELESIVDRLIGAFAEYLSRTDRASRVRLEVSTYT
ncbi:MAG: hypothetical protein U5K37_08065 [Natrialbaceae archaeon]|nr:hypothetical protein [Natrialbaceae archaeon]